MRRGGTQSSCQPHLTIVINKATFSIVYTLYVSHAAPDLLANIQLAMHIAGNHSATLDTVVRRDNATRANGSASSYRTQPGGGSSPRLGLVLRHVLLFARDERARTGHE